MVAVGDVQTVVYPGWCSRGIYRVVYTPPWYPGGIQGGYPPSYHGTREAYGGGAYTPPYHGTREACRVYIPSLLRYPGGIQGV